MRRKLAVADDHKFAGIDRADEFGADNVERHGFGREDVGIAQLADNQRTNAERIAAADHAFRGQADQRIGALDLFQRVDEAIEQGAIVGRGDEVDDDLGIARRLKDRSAAHQYLAQRHRVGNIAVMRDCKAAGGQVGEQRLDIAQRRLAGG